MPELSCETGSQTTNHVLTPSDRRVIQIRRVLPSLNEREPSYVQPSLLEKAYEAAAAALAFAVDPGKITMEPGVS